MPNTGLLHVGKATTNDPSKIGFHSLCSKPPDSTGGSKTFSVYCTQAGKRADMVFLRKHLSHARRLETAIKRGQSYFHLLQKEEREEEEERRQMSREEQLRTEPRPPGFSSDSDSDSEGCPVPTGASCSGGHQPRGRSKKNPSALPFTPVHYTLTSSLLTEAPREVIYRQLCCLNWLLEALALDRPGRVGPLTACWDPKDPGRGRTAIKTLKKEKAAENKWEQFVTNKPCRNHPRRCRSSSVHRYTLRRSSLASVASLSAITSVGSSLTSLVPGPEEDTGTLGAVEGTERPPSECLRTLSDVQNRFKKETSSGADWTPATTSHQISSKASMLQDLKAAFKEKAEEMAEAYINVLELKARERLNRGLQKYRELHHMTKAHHPVHHVTCKSQETEAPNKKNNHNNNMWLSTLLSSLPQEVCEDLPVSRVLQNLKGLAEQQAFRVRPQLFLKVLGGLEPWELCLPELCVAIQIAMDHVVKMSREEYDAWLFSRVTLPP